MVVCVRLFLWWLLTLFDFWWLGGCFVLILGCLGFLLFCVWWIGLVVIVVICDFLVLCLFAIRYTCLV